MLVPLKTFLARLVYPYYGKIQCDICGKWGTPNPNYTAIQTFVHVSKYTGGAFMHPEHVVRQIGHDLIARPFTIVKTVC